MPVVAVIGGIASAAAGAGAFSAAAGFTLANVVAGVQIVSGVAAALGAVTGNKTLQKIGLVGVVAGAAVSGLNSLTDGALLGTGTDAAGVTGAIKDTPAVKNLDWNSIQPASVADDAAEFGGLLGSSNQSVSSAIDAANASAGYGASASTSTPQAAAASAATQPTIAGTTPTGASAEMAAQTNAALNTGADALKMPGITPPPGTTPSKGLLGSVLDFTNNNPGAVKLISGLGGGLAQGYMTQQAEQAKLDAAEAIRRRYNDSILNQRRV